MIEHLKCLASFWHRTDIQLMLIAHVLCWLRCIGTQENLLGAFSNLNDFLTLFPEMLDFIELNPFKPRYLLVYSVVGRATSTLCSLIFCYVQGGAK